MQGDYNDRMNFNRGFITAMNQERQFAKYHEDLVVELTAQLEELKNQHAKQLQTTSTYYASTNAQTTRQSQELTATNAQITRQLQEERQYYTSTNAQITKQLQELTAQNVQIKKQLEEERMQGAKKIEALTVESSNKVNELEKKFKEKELTHKEDQIKFETMEAAKNCLIKQMEQHIEHLLKSQEALKQELEQAKDSVQRNIDLEERFKKLEHSYLSKKSKLSKSSSSSKSSNSKSLIEDSIESGDISKLLDNSKLKAQLEAKFLKRSKQNNLDSDIENKSFSEYKMSKKSGISIIEAKKTGGDKLNHTVQHCYKSDKEESDLSANESNDILSSLNKTPYLDSCNMSDIDKKSTNQPHNEIDSEAESLGALSQKIEAENLDALVQKSDLDESNSIKKSTIEESKVLTLDEDKKLLNLELKNTEAEVVAKAKMVEDNLKQAHEDKNQGQDKSISDVYNKDKNHDQDKSISDVHPEAEVMKMMEFNLKQANEDENHGQDKSISDVHPEALDSNNVANLSNPEDSSFEVIGKIHDASSINFPE